MLLVFVLGFAWAMTVEHFESLLPQSPETREAPPTSLDDLFEQLVILLPIALVALPLIWLITGWSLAPLAQASRQAQRIGPDDPSVRIVHDGLPREVEPLVAAVNDALDRLDVAHQAERRLTADAAHGIRTPLTVLNLRLQRARLQQEMDWPAVERDLAQMNRTVNQVIDLARREASGRIGANGKAPVNLSRVAREAAAAMLPMAEKAGRALAVEAPDRVMVDGRADDLRDMICNLVDNALAHGSGAIGLRVSADDGRSAVLEVADEGSGVPEELRASLFDRFRKVAEASPGAGLGLAIVRQIVQAHDGDVRFAPGPATVVRVSIPAGRAAPAT